MTSGRTATVGILGWPIEGSLSPTIHTAAFRALRMDWAFVPMPVEPEDLPAGVAGLAALGFRGANVTMPHKTRTAGLVDRLEGDAATLGAVNTIVVADDGLVGHNTDAPGFERWLAEDLAYPVAGTTALVYGAGGAARACILALVRAGVSQVVVAVRDRAKVAELAPLAGAVADRLRTIDFADASGETPDLVVNATPIGSAGDVLPLPTLAPGMLAVDLLYRPAVTPLVAAARAAGAAASNGLGLLLHQGALSFELWTGQVPPIDVMSAAAVAALAERPA